MTVNALKHRVDEPAAKPSSPSVKLTALLIAIMMNAAQKTQPIGPKSKDIESQRVKDTSVCTSVNRTIRIANPNATVESPIIFIFLFNPRFLALRIFIQSSKKPTSPAPRIASITKSPERV